VGPKTPNEHAIVYTPTGKPAQMAPIRAYLVATKVLCQGHGKPKLQIVLVEFRITRCVEMK
jgi:hypothetical protein